MLAYLDHAATTPLRPEAAAAMDHWLTPGTLANPSGAHSAAAAARQALDEAREVVSEILGTAAGDVVFTGSGSEAANLALLGRAQAVPGPLVVSAVEHHAVLHAAGAAERAGWGELRVVRVDGDGVIDLEALGRALDGHVSVVSVQLVNNEVGVLQPLAEVARLVRRRAPRALLHTDAVQAAPWYDLADLAAGADLVSISAHKFGGPPGVGALAFRSPVNLEAIIHGGPQERERRAGTQNVAGAVGLAAALRASAHERAPASERTRQLRDRLCAGLLNAIPGVHETAAGREKAPGHCHLVIEGVESEALLILLDESGVAASAGSACASGAIGPSHVLQAMGYASEAALGALRLTLGHTTTGADIDVALAAVPAAVEKLRARRAGRGGALAATGARGGS
ncbi:MAG TPA: aminotransferase class V-fold PLP-dependent enzyme [Acidimicrobiales bacterium]|nr:aminotransferase class V-fold PLP-dependent enzyme [Acidimicrobiales bacterium]